MLMDQYPLVLFPALAQAVGVTEAIALQQLHFHLTGSNNGREHAGEHWIYKTYDDWQKDDFPFLSTYKIQRIFLKLEKRKLIVSCQPESRDNRRKYYRIDYEELEEFLAHAHGTSQNCTFDGRKIARSSSAETTRTETTSKSTHQRAALMQCDFELSDYSEEEQKAIELYHKLLCDNGAHWKCVNKYSEKLSEALAGAGEMAKEIIQLAADSDPDVAIPKQRTLVRLLWDNWL